MKDVLYFANRQRRILQIDLDILRKEQMADEWIVGILTAKARKAASQHGYPDWRDLLPDDIREKV